MEAANLKKRMVRLSTKFHRRMTDDKRLNDISGYIDSIESTIDSILHDFLVSSNTPVVKEKPKETAVREFYEETNIKLNKKHITFFSEFSFFLQPKKKRIKRYFYTYKISNLKRFIKKMKVREGKKMKFFDLKNFHKIKKVVPYDKFILDYFFKIKNYWILNIFLKKIIGI